MHRIRLAALGAVVLLGFGAVAEAQRGGNEGRRRGERAQGAPRAQGERRAGGFLLRGIELTDAQQARVRTIDSSYRAQFVALRPQDGQRPDSAARAQRATQFQQIAQRQQAELRAVLTPAQQATFDRNVTQARERVADRRSRGARGARGSRGMRQDRDARGRRGMAAGRRGGANARPGARVAQAAFRGIELTDAQNTQLQAVRTRQRTERQALARQIRADGQRADSVERVRVRELATKQRGEVRALLTPAQQQRFDGNVSAMQERAREHGARRGGDRPRRERQRGGRRG